VKADTDSVPGTVTIYFYSQRDCQQVVDRLVLVENSCTEESVHVLTQDALYGAAAYAGGNNPNCVFYY
jgi:hypothetical protein